MTERLHTRFYYGTGPYYSLMRATRENVAFLGASLAVLGLGGGPHWSQIGDIVCQDQRPPIWVFGGRDDHDPI